MKRRNAADLFTLHGRHLAVFFMAFLAKRV
jgi:hypothetical protein